MKKKNTHSKGEQVKIPLLPNNVVKRKGIDDRVTTEFVSRFQVAFLLGLKSLSSPPFLSPGNPKHVSPGKIPADAMEGLLTKYPCIKKDTD